MEGLCIFTILMVPDDMEYGISGDIREYAMKSSDCMIGSLDPCEPSDEYKIIGFCLIPNSLYRDDTGGVFDNLYFRAMESEILDKFFFRRG